MGEGKARGRERRREEGVAEGRREEGKEKEGKKRGERVKEANCSTEQVPSYKTSESFSRKCGNYRVKTRQWRDRVEVTQTALLGKPVSSPGLSSDTILFWWS